ncbi:MAG: transposase [Vicinamibacterales bacterium]
MGRDRRRLPRGTIAHVLNRGVERRAIFRSQGDYVAFMTLLEEGRAKGLVDVFGYCVMPNHWHLLVAGLIDDGISQYAKWLTGTHVLRYRRFHDTLGLGHLYQGRFKSFIIDDEPHFLTVLRYIESNASRANLVRHAEEWEWSSAFKRGWSRWEITAPLPCTAHRLVQTTEPRRAGLPR